MSIRVAIRVDVNNSHIHGLLVMSHSKEDLERAVVDGHKIFDGGRSDVDNENGEWLEVNKIAYRRRQEMMSMGHSRQDLARLAVNGCKVSNVGRSSSDDESGGWHTVNRGAWL